MWLDGAARERASALIVDAARVLAPLERHRQAGLCHGAAGVALCLGHVGAALDDREAIDAAATLLDAAIDRAAALPLALGDGSVGVGWVLEHLQRTLRWTEDDPAAALDAALRDGAERSSGRWGWRDGVAGLATYALERLPAAPAMRVVLERLVGQLLDGAHARHGLGATWWTAAAHVAPSLRARHAWGHYDLGLAAGAPGVLAVLARISVAGVARAETRGLLARGAAWLWRQRRPGGLPRYLGPGIDEPGFAGRGSAAGWQRGVVDEPGFAGRGSAAEWQRGGLAHGALASGLALLAAVDALGDARVAGDAHGARAHAEAPRADEVIAWLREVARDHVAPHDDASVATGDAGTAQVCARLFVRTGDAVFGERAIECFHRVLASVERTRDGDPDLWTGLAGQTLALLSAIAPSAASWDRALLLSDDVQRTPAGAVRIPDSIPDNIPIDIDDLATRPVRMPVAAPAGDNAALAARFAHDVDALIARLQRQQPIAILQYGSSLRPADFVPGQSDLDLIVISDEPLRDVVNDLGYRYAFIPPRDFIAGVAAGDMFWLSALQTGRVRHDPRGFFAHLFALIAGGLDVRPNLDTIRSCAALIGTQLGHAMTGYFAGTAAPAAILRLLYSAAKGIGGYVAIASTGVDPHGYDGIVRSLDAFPEVADLMRKARADLHADVAHAPGPRPRLADDALGARILAVEACYLREVALCPGRRATNALLDDHADVRRALRVTLDIASGAHHIVAETTRGYAWFGLGDARHPSGLPFHRAYADRAELERALGFELPR